MRRVLIALAFIAGFAFSAGPALAQEGSDGSTDTETPSQTTEPTPEESPSAPAETNPPPAGTSKPPVEETPGTGDATPGTDQKSGSDQSGGTGGSSSSAAKLTNSQADPVDNLGDTVEGKTIKVCHASGSGTFTTGLVSATSVQDGSGAGADDIVKPFTYSGGGFDGLNWDTGKSIYNNDCTAPADASAPGGGAITAPCETDTVTLLEGDTTEGLSAAPNPGCEEASFEALVVDKVTICHRRAAVTNPYGPQAITVSVSSIITGPNGHGTEHTGPVFPDEGLDGKWGDIIPPFEFEGENGTEQFPGQNWDADGQAIFFNNCQIPGDEEPPPPGENKVPICHARNFGQAGDPYNRPNPSVEGILNGHAGHTGPVFFEGIQEQWGDIIPPFDFGPGAQFDGLNWDADGQAIYFNNCNVPGDEDDDDDGGDDDGDGDDGDGDDGDGDDDKGSLPDTGGQAPWILLTGGLLVVVGIAILSNGSMGRMRGSVGSVSSAAPWSYTIGRHTKV